MRVKRDSRVEIYNKANWDMKVEKVLDGREHDPRYARRQVHGHKILWPKDSYWYMAAHMQVFRYTIMKN